MQLCFFGNWVVCVHYGVELVSSTRFVVPVNQNKCLIVLGYLLWCILLFCACFVHAGILVDIRFWRVGLFCFFDRENILGN